MFIDILNILKYRNSRKYREPMGFFSRNANIEKRVTVTVHRDYSDETICEWIISALGDNLPLVLVRARV